MNRTSSTLCIVLAAIATADGSESIRFRRGDSNLDGVRDLSDAIHTLGSVFAGGPTSLECRDAADANDDGRLNITDGIYYLGFLFRGTAPPPPPLEECGPDPTADTLGCETFPACDSDPILKEDSRISGFCAPAAVGLGDLNDDGALDLVIGHDVCDGGISILLGVGDGSFRDAVGAPGVLHARSIVIEHLDQDGVLDIAVADLGVSVHLGLGDGQFRKPTEYGIKRGGGGDLAAGDLNGDGAIDLVVTSGDLSILLGVGDGTFREPVVHDLSSRARAITLGDLNGDGVLDVATTKRGALGGALILLGEGDGTFKPAVEYVTGNDPGPIALGDLDGDGALDVALGAGEDVAILFAVGDGTFGEPVRCRLGSSISPAPQALALGDFNGDGALDVASAQWSRDEVSILLGQGGGTFRSPARHDVGTNPFSLALGDIDGNGALDLAAVNVKSWDVSILLGH